MTTTTVNMGPFSRTMGRHVARCMDGENSASPDAIPDKAIALSILMDSIVNKDKNALLCASKKEDADVSKSNDMHRADLMMSQFIGNNLLFYQAELACDVLDRINGAAQKRPGSIISSPTGTGKTRIASVVELCVNPSSANWLIRKIDELFPMCDEPTVRLDSKEFAAMLKKRTGSAVLSAPRGRLLASLRAPFRKLRQSLSKIVGESIGTLAVSITEFTLFATPTNLIQQTAAEVARFHELIGLGTRDDTVKAPAILVLGPMSAKSGPLALMANAPACGRLYSAEQALAAVKNHNGDPVFRKGTIATVAASSRGNFLRDATAAFSADKRRVIGVAGFDGIGVSTRNVLPCVLLDMVERIFTNYGFINDRRDQTIEMVHHLLTGRYSVEYGAILEAESRVRRFIVQTINQTEENTAASVSAAKRKEYKYGCFNAVRTHSSFDVELKLDGSKEDLDSFLARASTKKIKTKGLVGVVLENLYHTVSAIFNNKTLRGYLKENKPLIREFGQPHVAMATARGNNVNGCSVSRRLLKILSTSGAVFNDDKEKIKNETGRYRRICQVILSACVALLEFYSNHILIVNHLSPINIIKLPVIMEQSTIVDRLAISVLDCFATGIIGDKDDSILLIDEVDFLRTRDTVAYRSIAILQPNFAVKAGLTATVINNNIADFTNIMSVVGQSIMISEESLEEFLAVGKNSKTYDFANRLPFEADGEPRMMNIMAFPGALSGLIRCITAMVMGGRLYRSQLGQRERDVVRRIYASDIHENNTTFTDPHIQSRIYLFQNSFKDVAGMIPGISPEAKGKSAGAGRKYDRLKTQVIYHLIMNRLYENAKTALGKRNNAERKIVYVPFRSKAEKRIYDALAGILNTYIRRKEAQKEGRPAPPAQSHIAYPRLFYGCMLSFLRSFTESAESACARLLELTHFDPTTPYKQISAATLKHNTAGAFTDSDVLEEVYKKEFIPILREMKPLGDVLSPAAAAGDMGDEGDDDDMEGIADEDDTGDRTLKILPFIPESVIRDCYRYLQNAHSSSLARPDSANSEEMKTESVDKYYIGTKFVALCDILQHFISDANKEGRLTHSIVSLNTKSAILTLYDLLLNTRIPSIRLIVWSSESKVEAIKKELATTKCHCIILGNAKLIARGFNLHEVDNIFDLDSEFNPVVANQMAGRGLRLTNKDAKKRIVYISIKGTIDEAVNQLHQLKNASSDTITSNIIDISSAVSDAIKATTASASEVDDPNPAEDEDDADMDVDDDSSEHEIDTMSRSRERRLLSLKLDHARSINSGRASDPDATPSSTTRKRKYSDITTATEKTISSIGRLTKASAASGKKTTLASLMLKTHDSSDWTKAEASVSPYEIYMTQSIEVDASSGRFIREGIDAGQTGRAHNLLSSTSLLDYVPSAKRQKTVE